MRKILAAGLMLLCTPAFGQDECRYRTGDGLSASIVDGGQLDIYGSDGSYERCKLTETEFKSMLEVACGDFVGDLFLVPKEPFGDFPDIIIMPPNILYWACAAPA